MLATPGATFTPHTKQQGNGAPDRAPVCQGSNFKKHNKFSGPTGASCRLATTTGPAAKNGILVPEKNAARIPQLPRGIQNYLGRISGPLLDRIDLHMEVPPVKFREMTSNGTGETSVQIRDRVVAARQRQLARFKNKPKRQG